MHCVYGQSRSAAIILSYLLFLGTDVRDALSLLKKCRPTICINPGFLAQLFLLSVRGFLSTDIQLILRKLVILKAPTSSLGATLSSGRKEVQNSCDDNDSQVERSFKFQRLNYSDSYKNVDVEKHLHESNLDICKPDEAFGHRDSKIELEITDCERGNLEDGVRRMKVSRIVRCIRCRHILAREGDIVNGMDYDQFLNESTDDYWKGYRPIHPSNGEIIVLDDNRNYSKNGKNDDSAANHIKVAANKNKRKIKGRPNARNDDDRGSNDNVLVVGALAWIIEQLDDHPKDLMKISSEKFNTDSIAEVRKISIMCPGCHHSCGYFKMYGLEICNSFLRCDLFALHLLEICITEN